MKNADRCRAAFAGMTGLAAVIAILLLIGLVLVHLEMMQPGAQYLAASGDGALDRIATLLLSSPGLVLLVFATLPAFSGGLMSLASAEAEHVPSSGEAWLASGAALSLALAGTVLGSALFLGGDAALDIGWIAAVAAPAMAAMASVLGSRHGITLGSVGCVSAVVVSSGAAVLAWLLSGDRTVGTTFFDPQAGADPVFLQHVLWVLGTPEIGLTLGAACIAALGAVLVACCISDQNARLRTVIAGLIVVMGVDLLFVANHAFTAGF
ncbi:MAG: hypothetical protein AAFV19_23380 [Pseudomonadota bacterium]